MVISSNFFRSVFPPFRYRRENNRLTSDQTRLQATYREMENQSKILSEKIARQQVCRCCKTRSLFPIVVLCSVLACVVFVSQTTLQGKIEREITEKKLTEDQVNNQRSYNWIFPNTLTVFKCFNWFSNVCVCRFQPQSVFPALYILRASSDPTFFPPIYSESRQNLPVTETGFLRPRLLTTFCW